MKHERIHGVSMDLIPQQGPYQIANDWGVHVACGMVLRSLDPGQSATCIQYDTVQKKM